MLQGVVVLTALGTAVLHGATAYPLAWRYGAYTARHAPEKEVESSMDVPVRVRHTGDSDAASAAPGEALGTVGVFAGSVR
jgi:hypothetical protein